MAGVLVEAGLAETVPLVYAHSALNFPDTPKVVDAVADKINMELRVIEPSSIRKQVEDACAFYGLPVPAVMSAPYSEWDLLEAIPKDRDITETMKYVYRACAAGNMLVAYTYEEDFDGSFVGLRAEESSGRSRYAAFCGYDHKSAIDGKRQVCPLLAWTGADVFAMILTRELPMHPFYRKAYESGLADDDPTRIRVDLTITPGSVAAKGGMALINRVYPSHFKRLASIRPELKQYI